MSKFTLAMNAAKDRSGAVAAESQPPATPPPAPLAQPQSSISAAAAAPAPSRRGRPAGKRSSEERVQVTAYIQAETHYAAKMALLTNSRHGGPKKDFSDLVEELLGKWLSHQQA